MADNELDMSAHYTVAGYRGVAFYIAGWTTEERYEGDYLVCDDEDCDHSASEMCWVEGDTSLIQGDMLRAVMVGDDREHIVDPEDLTKIEEADFCHECGQIGCTHDGLER